MRISIFGLGYVGAVCAGCLSARGHEVIGVDISQDKIDLINLGKSPIVEPGLGELLAQGIQNGRLRGTTNFASAIRESDLSMLCVGTPSKKNGDLELNYIEAVCREIGAVLRDKTSRHTIVVRSTVLPGTRRNVVIPTLEKYSGLVAGKDFGVAVNPEFLRESTAIKDYDFPAMTVIGELDQTSGDLLEAIYSELDAPIIRKTVEVAAPAAQILGIVADFEAYPQWNEEVTGCWILHRYDDGRPSHRARGGRRETPTMICVALLARAKEISASEMSSPTI